jgi:hypothetical protein
MYIILGYKILTIVLNNKFLIVYEKIHTYLYQQYFKFPLE